MATSCTAAGCWCGCASDRYGGKRTNWLLIKHRDEFAKEGEATTSWKRTAPWPPGARMDADRAGKGRAPKPFMLAQGQESKADAVWHSNRGEAADARAGGKQQRCEPRRRPRRARQRKAPSRRRFPRCRISSRRSFAPRVERPPNRDGWCHEIKFDGYRVQLRVEDGDAALRTRKGLDWTDKFGAIAQSSQGACPMR